MNTKLTRALAAALSAVAMFAFAQDAETVKVRGKGVGADKTEALKDAYRDAVERAVGLYVDAEQQMKNEELVNDQILTQSNAYIKKYEVAKETAKPNGLVEIQILAEVRKTALTKKLRDVMPKQTFALGDDAQNIHSRVVTTEKRNVDAAALLENVLKDVNPVKQLMKLSLSDPKPILQNVDGGYVSKLGNRKRVFFRFRFVLDETKYYGEFLPPLLRVLEQISVKPAKNVRLSATPLESKYILDMKHRYLSGEWDQRENVRDDGRLSGGLDCYYTTDEGVYVGDVSLSDAKGMGWHVSCSKADAFRSKQLTACSRHDTADRLAHDGGFHVLVITKMNSARTVIQARDYVIPQECAVVVQKWQLNFIEEPKYDLKKTAYNIIFSDGDGEEVYSSPVSFKNSSLANVFLGGASTIRIYRAFTAWFVTPMVHCDAEAFERWIGFDIPLDQLPNIKSVTVELAE